MLVSHPEHGKYFDALLLLKECRADQQCLPEYAGFGSLLRFVSGFDVIGYALLFGVADSLLWPFSALVFACHSLSSSDELEAGMGRLLSSMSGFGSAFVWQTLN